MRSVEALAAMVLTVGGFALLLASDATQAARSGRLRRFSQASERIGLAGVVAGSAFLIESYRRDSDG